MELTLGQQRDNLVDALSNSTLEFSFNDQMVMLVYTTLGQAYLDTLEEINSLQEKLFEEGLMTPGLIDYLRGPVRTNDGKVDENQEQLIFFFVPDEEFEQLREKIYPAPLFQGKNT